MHHPPADPDFKNMIHHSKFHHRNPIQETCFLFLAMR